MTVCLEVKAAEGDEVYGSFWFFDMPRRGDQVDLGYWKIVRVVDIRHKVIFANSGQATHPSVVVFVEEV